MHFVGAAFIFNLIVLILANSAEDLTVSEFIRKYNYPVETHSVETPDGFILKLQRIPHGVSNTKSKEVALLVHGMAAYGGNFVILGPPDALAFYLADRGYDVWIFNARGTVYSRKHRRFNPIFDSKKYWDFSWHEIGVIDLPTTIKYILKKTGKDKIFYVGHSQGTTNVLVMLSEMPEMNEKIKVAALLAPSVKLNYTHYPIMPLLAKLYPLGQMALEQLNLNELPIPNSPMINNILKQLCRPKEMTDICMDLVYLVGGTESGYTNKTLLPLIFQFGPSGFAVRQAWHYAQVIRTGEFKKYDYGKRKNLKMYNSTKPPLYNLSNIKTPIAIFYGPDDVFANVKMVESLKKDLPNVVLAQEIKAPMFNHIDYIVSSIAKEDVYDPLYELFQKYEENT